MKTASEHVNIANGCISSSRFFVLRHVSSGWRILVTYSNGLLLNTVWVGC